MIHLDLPEQMVMAIMEALGEYKFRLAAPVLGELQRQINAQRMPMQGNGKVAEDALPNQ